MAFGRGALAGRAANGPPLLTSLTRVKEPASAGDDGSMKGRWEAAVSGGPFPYGGFGRALGAVVEAREPHACRTPLTKHCRAISH